MDKLLDTQFLLRRYLPLLGGVCLCMYFSYHIIYGDRSYSRLAHLTFVAAEKEGALAELSAEKVGLALRVNMMRPNSLSVDLLDERVQVILGYGHVDEFVVLGDR